MATPGSVFAFQSANTLCARPYVFQGYTSALCARPQSLKKPVQPQVMDKYEKFCVDEAAYHIQRANELLTEGLKDPKKYYEEGQAFYRVLARLFPLFVLLNQCNESRPPDQVEEGNLSDSQSSVGSSEGSYAPVTP